MRLRSLGRGMTRSVTVVTRIMAPVPFYRPVLGIVFFRTVGPIC